jgi:hypothetical protein
LTGIGTCEMLKTWCSPYQQASTHIKTFLTSEEFIKQIIKTVDRVENVTIVEVLQTPRPPRWFRLYLSKGIPAYTNPLFCHSSIGPKGIWLVHSRGCNVLIFHSRELIIQFFELGNQNAPNVYVLECLLGYVMT